MTLSVAYITCRREPHFRWFTDSLTRQGEVDRIIVVDFYHHERPSFFLPSITHIPPKPCVWSGPHRLTSRDYFSVANARNTALCHAPDGWIAYVDDLSVLRDGWLDSVREAERTSQNIIRLGAYRKVNDLTVQSGEVSFTHHPGGIDSRWNAGSDWGPVPVHGSAMFGCSLAAPVEAFLTINGWDEDCDSMGGEDYVAGMMLEANGYRFVYDRRMLTYEDEGLHHSEPAFMRIDKGVSPHDASHRMLYMVQNGRNVAPNYFGPGGIRALRAEILAGDPFPVPTCPQHDWRDGQPLSEM